VYLLDGNALFGEIADMVLSDGYCGDTAAAYVVGIAYPGEQMAQWLSLRNHDLLHMRSLTNWLQVPAEVQTSRSFYGWK
jgi:hypothetical protein